MSQETNNFIAKVDAFANGLTNQERAMFQTLLASSDGDHEVTGFADGVKWPGLRVVSGPIPIAKLETDFGTFLSSGHTTGVVVTGEGGTTI